MGMIDEHRWQQLSFDEQMGNIASEVHRLFRFQSLGERESTQKAFERVLELIDATLNALSSSDRWRELARWREVLCDVVLGTQVYRVPAEQVEQYLMQFAYRARLG